MSDVNVNVFSYSFVQVALLIMYYGFDISLPKWVLWFPTIVLIIGIIFVIIIITLVGIMENLQ